MSNPLSCFSNVFISFCFVPISTKTDTVTFFSISSASFVALKITPIKIPTKTNVIVTALAEATVIQPFRFKLLILSNK